MAEEKDSIGITAIIAGRPYPLRVKQSDEAGLRKMISEINAKFNEFQVAYNNRDAQDCLVMTLLTYASELRTHRQAITPEEGGELNDKLDTLEQLLDGML